MVPINPLTDFGGEIDLQSIATATLSFSPLYDRSAIVTRIGITKPSAPDTWRVKVGQKELQVFRIDTVGNQQLLGAPDVYSPVAGRGFFDIYDVLNKENNSDLWVPVPNAMTFTVVSDGGATADIHLTYLDVPNGAITRGMCNHYQGNKVLTPIYGSRAAAVTVAGDNQFDTQIGPSEMPNIFAGTVGVSAGFKIEPLMLFIEAGGVNTYAAATDHLSRIKHLRIRRKQTDLYTHTAEGIAALGLAAAAGSVNKQYGTENGKYAAFLMAQDRHRSLLPFWKHLVTGELMQWYWNITGDVGAGADYSHNLVCLLAYVTSEVPFVAGS